MATYTVQTPDGKQITLEGPDGASHEEVIAQAQKLYQTKPADAPDPAPVAALAPKPQGPMGGTGLPDLGHLANEYQAAASGIVDSVPFAPNVQAAIHMGVSALTGHPESYSDAAARVKAQRNYLADNYPVSSGTGSVLGAVGTAAVGGAGLKATGAALPEALTLKEGQPLLNTARLAGAGAITGAGQGAAVGAGQGLDEGIKDASALGTGPADVVNKTLVGTNRGAVSGGVGGAVLAPVVGVGASLGVRGLSGIAPLPYKTARVLAKIFGEDAATLQSAWSARSAALGRPATLAEIANDKAQGTLAGLARGSQPISEATREASLANDSKRVISMQEAVSGGKPVTAAADVENATTAASDTNYATARQVPHTLAQEDKDFLQAKVLPNIYLKPIDRTAIAQQIETGTLSGDSAVLLDQKMSDLVHKAPTTETLKARDEFQERFKNPQLDFAREQHAKGKAAAEGTATGQDIVKSGDTAEYLGTLRGQKDGQAAGNAQGAVTALHTAAQTPESSAVLAQRLATDEGLYARNSAVFGEDTAKAFRRMGQAELASKTALDTVAPRTPVSDSAQAADDSNKAFHAVAAFVGHNPGSMAYHLTQFLRGERVSEATAKLTGKYLTDPKMVPKALALMDKAGVTNATRRRLALDAASFAGILGGVAAADATQPTGEQ